MNGNIGNALRELAPNTTWKLHGAGTKLDDLEWMDKPNLRPTDEAILQKASELKDGSRKQVEDQRKAAYMTETDPLFFQYQRGDVTEQVWLDAVQAVKDRFPYPA